MVHVISEPVAVVPTVSDKPCAITLARADAANDEELTTNQRHETVAIDPAARILLPAMDGTHNHAALVALLKAAALNGQLTFNKDGAAVSGADDIEAIAAQYLPELLAGIASAGLIES
jgi:hypothetical protein